MPDPSRALSTRSGPPTSRSPGAPGSHSWPNTSRPHRHHGHAGGPIRPPEEKRQGQPLAVDLPPTDSLLLRRKRLPLIVVADSGFFDPELFALFDALGLGFLIGGKRYKGLKAYSGALPEEQFFSLQKGKRSWLYGAFAGMRKSWNRFYRTFFTKPLLTTQNTDRSPSSSSGPSRSYTRTRACRTASASRFVCSPSTGRAFSRRRRCDPCRPRPGTGWTGEPGPEGFGTEHLPG